MSNDNKNTATASALTAPAGSVGVETKVSFWIEEKTTFRNRLNWLRKAFTLAPKVKTYHPDFTVNSQNTEDNHE